jgi:hypothetical protein
MRICTDVLVTNSPYVTALWLFMQIQAPCVIELERLSRMYNILQFAGTQDSANRLFVIYDSVLVFNFIYG